MADNLIDDKKNEEKNKTTANFKDTLYSFFISLIISILIILSYFSYSGLILYVCKLSQSNILPNEEKCYPYTDLKPSIQEIKTNIFTTFTEPQMSMKLEFPYNSYNSSNLVLDMLREYKENPSSNFLANYFISIVENLIQFNYASINKIMNIMNGLPEMLIILFGPIFSGILFVFWLFINQLYVIYLWFVNMYWFFKKNSNINNENENDIKPRKPKWDDVTIITPVDWGLSIALVILFIILFFVGYPFIAILPFLCLSWCLLSTTTYKGIMNNKNVTSLNVIKNVFKYYKLTIISIISFFMVSLAFSKLGTIPGIFSIITIILVYFGFIAIDIFKPIDETNLSPLTSYEQAKKICNYKSIPKEKHGLLYNLLIGQKGGGFTKELKKISEHLK